MKRLLLLRHAKSSWKHLGLSDHDRLLNKRGRLAAAAMGNWLVQNAQVPDVILSSTSVRTRETIAHLNLPEGTLPEIHYLDALYHAGPNDILQAAMGIDPTHDSAMIVGHQPGLGSFSGMLTKQAQPHCVDAYQHFPTAALAVFQADVRIWSDLSYCSAMFADFVKPRTLSSG